MSDTGNSPQAILAQIVTLVAQHDDPNEAYPKVRDLLSSELHANITEDADALAIVLKTLQDMLGSKIIHDAYLANFATSLLFEHIEKRSGGEFAGLKDVVDQHIKPKRNVAFGYEKLVIGLLVHQLNAHGASLNNSLKVAADMFGSSETDVERACKHYGELSSQTPNFDEEMFTIILLGQLAPLQTDWRMSEEKLAKENHNFRKAFSATYQAYDDFLHGLGEQYRQALGKELTGYSAEQIKACFSQNEAASLSAGKSSYSLQELINMGVLYIHFTRPDSEFDMFQMIKDVSP